MNESPPITPEHWSTLPFPVEDMRAGKIEIIIFETGQSLAADLHITQKKTNSRLFSVELFLTNLTTGDPYTRYSTRTRLSPRDVARIVSHPSSSKGFRYRLSMPVTCLADLQRPGQFRDASSAFDSPLGGKR